MSISLEDKVNALFVTLIVETKPLFQPENIGSPFILLHIRSTDNDEGNILYFPRGVYLNT